MLDSQFDSIVKFPEDKFDRLGNAVRWANKRSRMRQSTTGPLKQHPFQTRYRGSMMAQDALKYEKNAYNGWEIKTPDGAV